MAASFAGAEAGACGEAEAQLRDLLDKCGAGVAGARAAWEQGRARPALPC